MQTIIVLLLFTSALSAKAQYTDVVNVSDKLLQIRVADTTKLATDITQNKTIHLKIGKFNFSKYSCNIGFRIYLSFTKNSIASISSPNYIGSFFMGHDCNTTFIIPLEETITKLYQQNTSVNKWYFRFEFINTKGQIIKNENYLKGITATLLRH